MGLRSGRKICKMFKKLKLIFFKNSEIFFESTPFLETDRLTYTLKVMQREAFWMGRKSVDVMYMHRKQNDYKFRETKIFQTIQIHTANKTVRYLFTSGISPSYYPAWHKHVDFVYLPVEFLVKLFPLGQVVA